MHRTLLFTCAMVASQAALAQGGSTGRTDGATVDPRLSGDIVVTATRREERLQDVPLAVTALGEQTLLSRGINSVADLGSGRVPGLAVNSLAGAEVAAVFNIRGLGPNDAAQGTLDLPVAFYIDGANYARAQGAGMDLVTPERIEVLRGPQGQLFGRNAEAGAVQIISRRPSGTFSGDARVTTGNYNLFAAKARLDLPEIAGFRVQLSGAFRRHDGYVDNPDNPLLHAVVPPTDPASSFRFKRRNLDADLNYLNSYGGRIAIERDFGDVEAFYSYDRSRAEDDQGFPRNFRSPDAGTIFNPAGGNPSLFFTNLSGPGGATFTFTQPPLGKRFPNDATYTLPNIGFVTKSSGHLLNLAYPASDAITLKSITSTRSVKRYGGSASPAAVSPFLAAAYEYLDSDTFSQELQAIYDSDHFDLTMGAIYFQEDVVDERTSALYSNCRTSAVASAACVPGSSQATNNVHSLSGFRRNLSKSRTYGLYAQGTYTIGPVDLVAGIRYNDDRKVGTRVIDRALGIDIANGVGAPIRNEYSTHRFDPAFTIKYRLSPDVNVYGRYATSYRAGGSSVRSVTFRSFGEEQLTAWEVGMKSQWLDRRVTLNIAAFHNSIKNEFVSLQTAPTVNPAISETFNNPVDRKVKGLEVELSARLIRGLTLSGNYTYLHSSRSVFGFDPATSAVFVAPDSQYGPATGLILSPATIAAHRGAGVIVLGPIGTPMHSGSINVDYEASVGVGTLMLHGDWIGTSRFLTGSPAIYQTTINAAGTAATPVPNFNPGVTNSQFNGRIAYGGIPLSGNLKGELAFWIKNITDKALASAAFNAGINGIVQLAPPRTFGADFRVVF